MTDLEGLGQSYPPAVLAAAPRGANRMRARGAPAGGGQAAAVPTGAGQQAPSPRLRAAPGGYVTPVKAADRPRTITELAERVDPVGETPWPRGTSVPIGERGKRAHWTGTDWKGGESPGYPAAEGAEVNATAPATVELPAAAPPAAPGRHAAGGQSMTTERVQFPGDERPGDLTR